MAKPGIMIYFSYTTAFESLDNEKTGALLKAMLNYGRCGVVPAFIDPMLTMAWAFVKPQLDQDEERYKEKCLQGKYKVYCRESKKAGITAVSYDEWKEQQLSEDINRYQMITDDNKCYPNEPITITNTIPITSSIPIANTNTIPNADDRKPQGKYQKVLLTDGELQELQAEYGTALTDAAIDYLDMYIKEKGYTSSDHCVAIRRWVMDVVSKKPTRRREPAPDPKRDQEDRMLAIKALGNDPELAARAEELKQKLCKDQEGSRK